MAAEPAALDRDLAALRLDLTNQGLRLGEDLLAGGFALGLASAEGIDLVMPDGRWSNVSISPGYAGTSPYVLVEAGSGFAIRHRAHGSVPVCLPDTVRFRHARTHSGFSCGDIGAVHGRWLVVAPITVQNGLALDRPRRYLGLPPHRPLTKSAWSVDEVVACAEAAWVHAGIRAVHLEAGALLKPDGGVADLLPYVTALRRALPVLVSVSVLPPEDPTRVLDLYAGGVDAVSYHLLAWDEGSAQAVAPLRTRFCPHARVWAALHAAARIFPRGAVSSDLLVGLESLDHLPPAMTALAEAGVVPNLTVFRPLPGAEDDAPNGELVPTERVVALMDQRRALLAAHGLQLSRVRGFPRVFSGYDRADPRRIDLWYASLRRWARIDRQDEPGGH